MERFLQTNTLSGKSHGRMRKAYCLSSAVHHLDSASLHLDGGRSPYMNRNLLSMECKHSKPSIFYSCTAHFSTIIVPNGKKQARKCPFLVCYPSSRQLKKQKIFSARCYAGQFLCCFQQMVFIILLWS